MLKVYRVHFMGEVFPGFWQSLSCCVGTDESVSCSTSFPHSNFHSYLGCSQWTLMDFENSELARYHTQIADLSRFMIIPYKKARYHSNDLRYPYSIPRCLDSFHSSSGLLRAPWRPFAWDVRIPPAASSPWGWRDESWTTWMCCLMGRGWKGHGPLEAHESGNRGI